MNTNSVRVPGGLHALSRLFAATAGAWRRLGDLETRVLGQDIATIAIDRPVYVTSLARAGTTIVTEMLERHPLVTSHRYSDFPNVWTPYWRNHLLQATRRETPAVSERAHGDRIQVSNDSPEAVEEILWMHFFPGRHDPALPQALGEADRNPAFDAFYMAHIRKLLAVRKCHRYLAKGNYNLARLGYLLSLFADARFLVPLRDPVHHLASLVKQHRLFTEASRLDARVGRQLALSGHFEFGPRRRFAAPGDSQTARAVATCWAQGREAEGWALAWAATYRHLADRLDQDEKLRRAVLLFRYEDLCRESGPVIDAIVAHCGLEPEVFQSVRDTYRRRLSLPTYYRPEFDATELRQIQEHCAPVLERLGNYCLAVRDE